MVEAHRPELEERELRYNGSTWELTGDIEIRKTGEVIHAGARNASSVRGNSATLSFVLEEPPASLNPGNLEDFHTELRQRNGTQYLRVVRERTTDEYELQYMGSR